MIVELRTSKWVNTMLILAVIFSIVSQIPIFFDDRRIIGTYLTLWSLIALILALKGMNFKLLFRYCWCAIIFDVFSLLMRILQGWGYVSSNLFYPVNLSTFILLIGILAGKYIDDEAFKKLAKYYIITAFALSIYIYINYFLGVDWAGTREYLYTSKNSAGQILLSAVILTGVYYLKGHRLISIGVISLFSLLILMMKSRAVIVALATVLIIYFLFVEKKMHIKILGVLFCSIIVYITLWNEETYNLLINQIMLNNNDPNDVTAVSTDRDIHYQYFTDNFKYYWLTGTGGTYLESMPLAALFSYGLLGGVPLLLFSLVPVVEGIKSLRITQYKRMATTVFLIGISMLVNSFFEELAPFGPGVKCFFLWLAAGILIGNKYKGEFTGNLDDG